MSKNLTTDQAMKQLLKDVKAMSPEEKAEFRKQVQKSHQKKA